MTKKAVSILKRYPKVFEVAKSLVPGAGAGAIAATAVMPLDTISDTQKQWRNDPKASPRIKQISRSFIGTAKEINKQEGPGAFYAGYGGKLVKVIPSAAITFAAVAALNKKLGIKPRV